MTRIYDRVIINLNLNGDCKMVTIKDVAREAGVSIATVSYVINDTRYVTPELRLRIEQAVKKLGYRPNMVARSLRTQSSQTVAFICADITNPFNAMLVKGLEDRLWESRYGLIICNTNEDVEKEKAHINLIRQQYVDGLIISPAQSEKMIFEKLKKEGYPFVVVDRKIDGLEADVILSDNVAGSYNITRHLIELGHKDIGIVKLNSQPGPERLQGYKKALLEYGIPYREQLVSPGLHTIEGGFQAAKRLLSLKDRPSAIFTTINAQTVGALKVISEFGLSCPEDISLAGFDEFEWSPYFRPALTGVAQFPYDIGVLAAETLFARIEDPDSPFREVRVSTELVIRDSARKVG